MVNTFDQFIRKTHFFTDYEEEEASYDYFESPIDGGYIGDEETARFLGEQGILPQKSNPEDNVCNIGLNKDVQRWYGWSHRAMCSFGIGSRIEKGYLGYIPDNPEEMIEEHANWLAMPEDDPDVLKFKTVEEVRAENKQKYEERKAECQILPDRSGIRILHTPIPLKVLKEEPTEENLTAAFQGDESVVEDTTIDPGYSIRKCGRGEWEVSTLEEAKEAAMNFAESVA